MRCFSVSALIATLSCALLPAATGSKSDAVVITVAGNPIKRAKIDTLVDLMAKAQGVEGPLDSGRRGILRKMVATNLVGQELLEREAKARQIAVSSAETDSVLGGFRRQFPDEAGFQRALRENGDSEAKLKEKLKRQIRADKVLSSRVSKPEPPTEKEMADFWAAHKSEFPLNDSLRALQIVLLADSKSTSEIANQKRHKLEELRGTLARDSGETPALIRSFRLPRSGPGSSRLTHW